MTSKNNESDARLPQTALYLLDGLAIVAPLALYWVGYHFTKPATPDSNEYVTQLADLEGALGGLQFAIIPLALGLLWLYFRFGATTSREKLLKRP